MEDQLPIPKDNEAPTYRVLFTIARTMDLRTATLGC